MYGETNKQNSTASSYIPTPGVLELTKYVKKDYATGYNILHDTWTEFNDHSVIDRMNIDSRTFNSFVDESIEDPNEAWKWRGTRSLARNKAMAMHAHLTSQYIVPQVFAQNESQEEDRTVAEAMRDILEWMTVNSPYRQTFMATTLGVLYEPVVFFETDYCEVYQKIKEKTKTGYKTKEVLDEVLSGFQPRTLSADQVLITNAYQQNIQKQRCLIKRRWIEYQEAEAKWEDHDNWQYVQPGMKTVYSEEDGLFYDVVDDEHQTMVEECVYMNRREDTECTFIGGIYMGDSDPDMNPMKHRDNRDAPKYDVIPFGYERINEHFFYFKSMMFRVGWDDKLIDAMYEMVMNREFLDLNTPIFYSGMDAVDTNVVFPGASVASQNPDAKATPIIPASSGNGYRALKEIEASMSEASVNETQMGALPEASQKAYTVAQADKNARILLQGISKNIAESIVQVGQLMVDIALNHITAPQLDEITNAAKYRQFVISDQIVNGKKVSKKVRFDEALMGEKMDEEKVKEYSMKLLTETGYPDNKEEIIVLNPHLFSKMKYLCYVEANQMLPRNEEFDRIMMERLYTLLGQDPMVDHEALLRQLLYASNPRTADGLMAKTPQASLTPQPQGLPGVPVNPAQPTMPDMQRSPSLQQV